MFLFNTLVLLFFFTLVLFSFTSKVDLLPTNYSALNKVAKPVIQPMSTDGFESRKAVEYSKSYPKKKNVYVKSYYIIVYIICSFKNYLDIQPTDQFH